MKRYLVIVAAVFTALLGVAAFGLPPGGPLGGSVINPFNLDNQWTGVQTMTTTGAIGSGRTKGGIAVSALATPTGCAVAKTGTGTGTTWGYRVSALSATGETLACAQVTVSGNATLDGTHYNTVTWTAVSGARGYYVYRTAAPGTPNTTGKLGTGACTPTVVTVTSHVDNGLCADSSSVLSTATDAKITGATLTGNADTATALAANPTDCTVGTQFANAIAANGNLSCAQPSDVTGNAATATALAADPTDCAANQFATGIATSGNLTCAQPAVANISDIATNYCALAGCTMVGNLLFTDNTLDIGASGATRPRTGYFGTDVNVGGDVNVTDDLTCNQATATVNAIGASSTTHDDARNGMMLVNSTSCATGTTTQVSPAIQFTSHALDSDASDPDKDDTWDWRILNIPTTGPATTSKLSFQVAKKAGTAAWGTFSEPMNVDNGGSMSILGTFNSGASISLGGVSSGYWTVSSSTGDMSQGSAYQHKWANSSNAVGGTFDVGIKRSSVGVIGITNGSTGAGALEVGSGSSFGGGSTLAVVTKLTTDATPFNIWTAAALAAESCVTVQSICTALDKADTLNRNSYDKETTCCNKAGTTACDAITTVREVEVQAAWNMTIQPCDAVAAECLVADAPAVQITGAGGTNINWKCTTISHVLTNG